MKKKACFKCGEVKALDLFYRFRGTVDGHFNACKECMKRDAREYRLAHVDRYREYDRARAKLPHRKAANERIYRAQIAKHPERKRANQRAWRSVKAGRLQAKTACERCGIGGRLQMHHRDYSKQLDVLWLCPPCHAIADKARRQVERMSK